MTWQTVDAQYRSNGCPHDRRLLSRSQGEVCIRCGVAVEEAAAPVVELNTWLSRSTHHGSTTEDPATL